MTRIIPLLILLLGLAGCSSSGTHSLNSKFNPKEAMYIFTVGRASISGRAFVKSANGRLIPASGSVTLVPATQYAQERINVLYRGRSATTQAVRFPNADPRYLYFTRKTSASKNGSFKFVDISNGEYFVTTTVVLRGGKRRHLIKRISVGANAKVEVVLTESVS